MSLARDIAAFLAAALVPAAAVGWLGLRALKNEEAALRREATLEVAQAADRASRSVLDGLERATRDVAGLAMGPVRLDDPAELTRAFSRAAAVTPAFAEPAVVTADGRVLVPRAPAAPGSSENDACRDVGSSLEPRGGHDARRAVLACPDARDPTGRWIFPVIAIDELRQSPDPALATELAAFFEGHASSMRPEERDVARDEIGRLDGLPDAARARVESALERGASSPVSLGPLLARAWRADAALRALSTGEGTRRFEGPRVAGVVRSLGDGAYLGLVVTPETLGRALVARPPLIEVPAGVSVEIASDATRVAPDAVEAVAFVSDGLGFHARLARPDVLSARTSRSARILGALIGTSAALAVGLATVLFLRVRAARRTSELRTSFVAAVSHELKTPIASVRMLSELLAQGRVEDDERVEVAEALVREAHRMGDTVERFLTYARMERGKLVARRASHDLVAVARQRVEAFEARHPELPVSLEAPASLTADVDRAQIELCLDNLLENAAKHAPSGAPYAVTIGEQGANVEIRVSDRGPGVPRALRRRVFLPFERGDDRLSRATDGTGLGLALVRAAAEAHGGAAEIDDGARTGTTVLLRLPRRAPAPEENA